MFVNNNHKLDEKPGIVIHYPRFIDDYPWLRITIQTRIPMKT